MRVLLYRADATSMGVSATGESGETFPTRILMVKIYWGISPAEKKARKPLTRTLLGKVGIRLLRSAHFAKLTNE